MNVNYLKKYSLWILTVIINSFGNFLMIKSEMGSGPWIKASMGISKSTRYTNWPMYYYAKYRDLYSNYDN